jgi:hypothetical protein
VLGGVAGAEEGKTSKTVMATPEEDRPPGVPDEAEMVSRASPEKSGDSFCEHNIGAAKKRDLKTKNTCEVVPVKKVTLAGKWTAKVVSLNEHSTGAVLLDHYVELQAAFDGKWISHRLGHVSEAAQPDGSTVYEVRSIYVKDVIRGGAPELVVDSVETQVSTGGAPGKEVREFLDICGVGVSAMPSCFRVTVAEVKTSDDHKEWSYKYRLAWSFDKKGRLVLKPKGAWPKNLEKRDYVKTTLYWFR